MTKIAAIGFAAAVAFGILVGAGATFIARGQAVDQMVADHPGHPHAGQVMPMMGGVDMPAGHGQMDGSAMPLDRHDPSR